MHTTSWLPLRSLAALCLLTACGSDPTGPDGPGPGPGPTTEPRWDIDVIVRYVKASGNSACDGTTIIGTVNPGEFQYRITASFGELTKRLESNIYGSVAGADHTLGPEEIHNFANETWTFNNLREGQGVELRMHVTEWDGTEKDDYMNNRTEALTITPSALLPNGGTRTDRALGVGTSNCGLTLYHDVTVRQRQVTVD